MNAGAHITRRALLATATLPLRSQSRPVPRLQAVPEAYEQVSIQRQEKEIARLHHGATLNRPFVYPVIGPSGRGLTRMGHPGDPYGHSHHNSIWICYSSVNGVDFWSDHRTDGGRIVTKEVFDLIDDDARAGVITRSEWIAPQGKVLLNERRETWAYPLESGQWLLVIDLTLQAVSVDVVFEKASFGPIGVRMAKPLSAFFGDGVIRNSSGASGEPAIFRKPAKWVDYSGSIANGVPEGLTLFDHPMNPGHPSPFHVRVDGWMGAMLSMDRAFTATHSQPLRVRYGVFVHSGAPTVAVLEKRWADFAKLELHPPYGPPHSRAECENGGHKRFNVPDVFATPKACMDAVKPPLR